MSRLGLRHTTGLLEGFAMKADIEAHDFVFLTHTQRDQRANDFEDYEGQCSRPHQCDNDPVELGDNLLRIAFKQAVYAARQFRGCRQRTDREHARKQGAGHSADAMHAEHIE